MRKTVFLGLITAFLWALSSLGGEALAQNASIQMLPPENCDFDGLKTGVIGWDEVTSLKCINGFEVSNDGKSVAVKKNFYTDGLVDLGDAEDNDCKEATKGALRYHETSSEVQYCNGSTWRTLGEKKPCPAGDYLAVQDLNSGGDMGSFKKSSCASAFHSGDFLFVRTSAEVKHGGVLVRSTTASLAGAGSGGITTLVQCDNGKWIYRGILSFYCDGDNSSDKTKDGGGKADR